MSILVDPYTAGLDFEFDPTPWNPPMPKAKAPAKGKPGPKTDLYPVQFPIRTDRQWIADMKLAAGALGVPVAKFIRDTMQVAADKVRKKI